MAQPRTHTHTHTCRYIQREYFLYIHTHSNLAPHFEKVIRNHAKKIREILMLAKITTIYVYTYILIDLLI